MKRLLTATLFLPALFAGSAQAANDDARLEAACLADLRGSELPGELTYDDLAPSCTCLVNDASSSQKAQMHEVLDARADGEAADFPASVQDLFRACFPSMDGDGEPAEQ